MRPDREKLERGTKTAEGRRKMLFGTKKWVIKIKKEAK